MQRIKTCSLIVIIFFMARITYSQETNQNNSYLPTFVFFFENNCVGACDIFPINSKIISVEKSFPGSKIMVYVKMPDSSLADTYIKAKIKSKNVIFVYDDSTDIYFGINSYPTLLVFNFNGNEIARFEKKEYNKISQVLIRKKYSVQEIGETVNVKYPIVSPQNQYLSVLDSIVYYADEAKNEIGEFNLFTGDSIRTILPDDKLLNYNIENKSLDSVGAAYLKERLYPLSSYKIALPINKEKILCMTYLTSVSIDTIQVKDSSNNKISPSVRTMVRPKSYLVQIENGKTTGIDTLKLNQYGYSLLQQLKNKKYFAQLYLFSPKGININDSNYLDNKCLFIQSDNPDFSSSEMFFSFDKLKKSYGFDTIRNVRSPGVVDYNPNTDEYLYLNPYKGVFCKYNKTLDSVFKITPKGLIADVFSKKGNLFSLNNSKDNEDLMIIFMDWYVSDKEIKVLLFPKNKKKYSDCIVVDTYDLDGNFIKESILQYSDKDLIRHFSLINDTSNDKGYLLIQSQNRKWQITELK